MGDDEDVNWQLLAAFHSERAGVTEAVLSRALAGDHSPLSLARRAVATATVVVDLACGFGRCAGTGAARRTVVGLDLSESELALAVERGPGPWVRAVPPAAVPDPFP